MPAPDKLPADFDFSKQGPPDKLPANFDFGGGQPKQPENAGYLQELWKQADLPGIVKSLKEHPAETVANAIGGLFAPLNPNFTQSPQGQAMRENLTRSPQSAAAALTLGGLAMAPAAAGPIAEGLVSAGKYVAAGAKAGTPGVLGGLAKAGAGEVLAKIPGMELPARFGLQYPALRQVAKAIEKGHEAGMKAIAPEPAAPAAATRAAVPPPARASEAPAAATPPVTPEPEAPTPAIPGKTAEDLLNEEMGTKAVTPVTAKAPGQALAESHGETWSKLSQDDKLAYAQLEGAQATSEARNAGVPSAYAPRPPEYYGVKPAAEVPPTPPPPSAPAPAQATSAAPVQASAAPTAVPPAPKVQPIRPAPPAEAQDIDFQMRYGEQEQPEVAKFLGHEQPATPSKEPWQMTQEEYLDSYEARTRPEIAKEVNRKVGELQAGVERMRADIASDPGNPANGGKQAWIADTQKTIQEQTNRLTAPLTNPRETWSPAQIQWHHVGHALEQGKPVPPEALAAYPELAPKPAPEPPAPKPASGATAAKSARYADAISKWAKDMGMSPKDIADQWGTTTPEVRGQILLQLKQKGYLGANETIPRTSAQGIVDALKAKAATIKPPKGFSLGEMGTTR